MSSRREPNVTPERPRILIVDDDPMMGATLRIALEDDYEVEVCPSADAAMTTLDKDTFDLILCDLMMPRTSGMDLYRWLQSRDPRSARRMLFMTGGAYTETAARFLRDDALHHVEKPFRVDQLLGTIESILADPS